LWGQIIFLKIPNGLDCFAHLLQIGRATVAGRQMNLEPFSVLGRENALQVICDQFNQFLAVDETNGNLGAMYYDTVADANRKKVDVYYQMSSDGGAIWQPAVKVTTAMTDETVAGADSGNQYGDYNGLSIFASKIFPSWTDRRDGGKEEIWTAPITEP